MEKVNDKWVRIGAVLLLLILLFVIDAGGSQRPVYDETIYLASYTVSVVLIMEASRLIILTCQKKMLGSHLAARRLRMMYLGVFASDFLLIEGSFYGSHYLRGMHPTFSSTLVIAVILASAFLAALHIGIYERYFYVMQLRKVEQENNELLRMQLQTRFDSLKEQLNPHFLFNNMNTISSLIDKSPERAKSYLLEMSKVYRYLLTTNEQTLTSLENELNFLDSYFHLLKTRFGDAIDFQIIIDKKFSPALVPTLTLQLLVENAVKHNSFDRDRPLLVEIGTADPWKVWVKNNRRSKINTIPSTRIGLNNIMAKYKLLNCDSVSIEQDNEYFMVTLPLINPQQDDNYDNRGRTAGG